MFTTTYRVIAIKHLKKKTSALEKGS